MGQNKRDDSRTSLKERDDERRHRYLHSEVLDDIEDGIAARVPDVNAPLLPFRAGLCDPVGGVAEPTTVEFLLQ